jgi:hypothetical protein
MSHTPRRDRRSTVGKADDWKIEVLTCPASGTVKVLAFARHGGMHVMELPVGCVPELVRALKAAVR